MESINTIDEYISQFPHEIKMSLNKIRQIIKTKVPDAKEAIKYGMPTFVLNGNLVHFAAFKKHIGFYPTPTAIVKFKNELEKYKTSKGAIQFPLDQEIPYDLIKRMVEFRVGENTRK